MKELISTTAAPAAIGPYSQGILKNGMVFVSGQLPIHAGTGKFAGDTIEEQTKQVLENLKHILEAGGASLLDVVKTTVFLKDMEEFSRMNDIYSEYFFQNYPARVCVEVARLPKDAKVEIEALAIMGE